MTRKWLAIVSVVFLVVSLAGCVTDSGYYDPYRSAGAGALGGAATGAAIGSIIGAATGHAATGAWVGAAAGGVLGGVGGAVAIVAMTSPHPPDADGLILSSPAVWGRATMPCISGLCWILWPIPRRGCG